MKEKVKKILTPIIIAVVVAAAFGSGFWVSRLTLQGELNDLNYIIEMYRRYYYDEQEDIVGIFADSLLDAYSDYYTKEEYELIKKADAGGREGIGISFSNLTITGVIGNSPAQKAGLKEGGVIKGLFVDGEFKAVSSSAELTQGFDGIDAYTDFGMIVDYDGEEKTFTLQKQVYLRTFVRYRDNEGEYGFSDESGSMEYVRVGDGDEALGSDTAYIKYEAFSGTASGLAGSIGQFARAMSAYKDGGKRNIIIDLRGNGGGFMYILEDVCKYFLDVDGGKQVICVVRDKYGNENRYYSSAVTRAEYTFDNIIVLADSGTASASEAFIGALLDYNDSGATKVIVSGYKYGNNTIYRSYGKGIMQTTFERLGGGAIKLTTAKLFWPNSDVCIHGVGVTTALNDVFEGKIINESENGAYSDALSLCR